MPSLRPTWLISLLTLAGCAGSAYQGPPSDHFDGERFRNIQPTAHKSLRDLLKWQWNRPPLGALSPGWRGVAQDGGIAGGKPTLMPGECGG